MEVNTHSDLMIFQMKTAALLRQYTNTQIPLLGIRKCIYTRCKNLSRNTKAMMILPVSTENALSVISFPSPNWRDEFTFLEWLDQQTVLQGWPGPWSYICEHEGCQGDAQLSKWGNLHSFLRNVHICFHLRIILLSVFSSIKAIHVKMFWNWGKSHCLGTSQDSKTNIKSQVMDGYFSI